MQQQGEENAAVSDPLVAVQTSNININSKKGVDAHKDGAAAKIQSPKDRSPNNQINQINQSRSLNQGSGKADQVKQTAFVANFNEPSTSSISASISNHTLSMFSTSTTSEDAAQQYAAKTSSSSSSSYFAIAKPALVSAVTVGAIRGISSPPDSETTAQSRNSDSGSISGSVVSKQQKSSNKINAMKTEIAILQDTLEKSRSKDIELLESKVRTHYNDIVTLRQRNTELRETIQQLETKLFDAMKEISTLKAGKKGGKRQQQGGTSRTADYYSDAEMSDNDEFYEAKPSLQTNKQPFSNSNKSNRSSNNHNNSNSNSNNIVDADKIKIAALERRCHELEILVNEYMGKLSTYKYSLKTPEKKVAASVAMTPTSSSGRRSSADDSSFYNSNSSKISSKGGSNRSSADSNQKPNSGITYDSVLSHLPHDEIKFLKGYFKDLVKRENEEKDKTIKELSSELVRLEKEKEMEKKSAAGSKAALMEGQTEGHKSVSEAGTIGVGIANVVISKKESSLRKTKDSKDLDHDKPSPLYLFLLGSAFSIIATSFYQWRDVHRIVVVICDFLMNAYREYNKSKGGG